jgi:ABC-2 type transport system permease protein
MLPASHVFEGMRSILVDGTYRPDLMLTAAAINIVYVAIGMAAFLGFFRSARVRGLVLQVGE